MNPNSFDGSRVRDLTLFQMLSMSIVLVLAIPVAAVAETDLTEMSLEELMNIEVTSVSKKAQGKTTAAAAITVITSEDLRRGGFTVIPEALRTVPGVQVGRVDANRWSISARGSTGLFANKLLVLIDGRSVYTPAFGGTYWDVQDYPIEDVERIEVIRGPGGTIWGANAVNGVINIITKDSKETQGTLLSGYGGSHQSGLTARYGGKAGENTHYRAYVRGFRFEDFSIDKSYDGNDEFTQGRFGIRIDSQLTESDTLRISGDFYAQDNEQGAFLTVGSFRRVNYEQRGGNILVNWDRKLSEDSNIQAKAYYIGDDRDFLVNEVRHTADLELQHNFMALENLAVTWGGNYRYSTNKIDNRPVGTGVTFVPDNDDVHIASTFAQAQLDLFDKRLSLILGTKLGYYNWSGFEFQPSVRVIATPVEGHAIWGAISRAVRTPTQSERDVILPVPPSPLPVVGNRDFRSEDLLAFELGYRFFSLENFNAEVSLFWNEYENRSSFRLVAGPAIGFANESELTARGVEIELNVRPTPWWRIKMAYSFIEMDENLNGPAISLSKVERTNPKHQFNIQTLFDLPMGFEFDATVYYVDGLPGTVPTAETKNVQQYIRLDMRIGYKPADWIELSLVGQNLTRRRHYESDDFTLGQSTKVPRSGYAKVTLNF